MEKQNNISKKDGSGSLRSSDWLAVGTRILMKYGHGVHEAEVIAQCGDIFALSLSSSCEWKELMTRAEILEHRAIPLAPLPKKVGLWKRIFSSANVRTSATP